MNRFLVSCMLMLSIVTPSFAQVQEAADIPEEILFLGWWDRAQPALYSASYAEQIGVEVLGTHNSDSTLRTLRLSGRKVVLIGQLDAEQIHVLLQRIIELPEGHGVDFILAVDRASHEELLQQGLARKDAEIQAFCYPPSAANYRGLLRLLAIRYQGLQAELPVPAPPPEQGLYHPEADGYFDDLASYRNWLRAKNISASPTILLQVQGDYLHLNDHAVIDALIHALEGRKLQVVTVFGQENFLKEIAESAQPGLLITLRHTGIEDEHRRGNQATLVGRLGVPYLGPISMLSQTWESWRKEKRGTLETSSLITPRELHGIIEPLLIGGSDVDSRGLKAHTPDAALIDRFCDRVLAWLSLAEKPVSNKKIAVIYYHKYLGKGDVGRSRSVSGLFLDTHASLLNFAEALRGRGYQVEGFPKTIDALVASMQQRGRVIPSWGPGEMSEFLANGEPVLLPVEDYLQWYNEEIPAEARRAIEDVFGPPPGDFMVWRQGDQAWFVLPAMQFGNVLLAPQPDRGDIQDVSLIHDRRTPPPHQYLAFYLWLRHGFGADAVVHFGTHGNEIYLPGKDAGLAVSDFPSLCLGNLPNINPWIIDNLGEAIIAKRRASAVLVDHLGPPTVGVKLEPEYRKLREDLAWFRLLEDGAIKEQARADLSQRLNDLELGVVTGPPSDTFNDLTLGKVLQHLHNIAEEEVTLGQHRLGEGPEGDLLKEYLQVIENANPQLAGNTELLDELAFDLGDCKAELDSILDALDGRFVPPGPGPGPDINPSALPTGRNLYGLDPEIVPTRQAWEVASGLIDEILQSELIRTGEPARQLAFNLNGMETFRDFGVMEAEAMQALGVRPVWSPGGRIVDLNLVPREELGRPRCDVFLATGAIYLKNFPTRVLLLDQAVRLAASSPEADNPVRHRSQQLREFLAAQGVPPDRASFLAQSRVFGTVPGGSGFRLEYLFPRSGEWDDAGALFRAYRVNASHVFSADIWGIPLEQLWEQTVSGSQAVVTTWGSRMVSPLASHHAVEGTGGLSLAVEQSSGEQPAAYVSDLRSPKKPSAKELDAVLAERLSVELLDSTWIRAQMSHEFGGAGQMAELVRNAFGWRALRSFAMPPEAFEAITSVYIDDSRELGLRAWFEKNNPYSFQTICAVLLESGRRGFWSPDKKREAEIAVAYADSVVRFGYNDGAIEGGNIKLRQIVEMSLAGIGEDALLESYRSEVDSAENPASGEEVVVGEVVDVRPPADASQSWPIWRWLLMVSVAAAFLLGMMRRSGSAREV